ncbi:MAG: Mth938-like domain-containing protein [Pseudomonadota bacterium]
MVLLKREHPGSGPMVTGFTGTGFRVDGEVVDSGLWLTPEWSRAWDTSDMKALDAAMLDPLLSIDPLPEFLLLGTGASLRRPTPAFIATVEARHIGVETMDSRAAARSWGLLRSEDRWIVAALLPLDQA